MTNLESHLLHRERLQCPLIARAWSGGEAAHRLSDVKAAKDEALPYYQELIRIWDAAGPNLRAVIEADYLAGVALMAKRWAEYDRAVRAEHVLIGVAKLEEAA